MKKLFLIVSLSASCCWSVGAQTPATKNFTLFFDYPHLKFDTNLVFRAHSSTNLALSVTNWPIVNEIWSIVSSNNVNFTFSSSNKVLATSPETFFAVSVSNEWGLVFSEILTTKPPGQGSNLRVR